jgi:thiol-disulfide isomerase/thioredoxin
MRRPALLSLILLFIFLPLRKDPHLLTATDVEHRRGEPSQAPDFRLTDFNGEKLTLSQYKGKVVLLDFWASWCTPCRAEIPKFIEWQKKYSNDGFQVIGISMDDDEKAARKFVELLKPNYPVAMGTPTVAESYGGVLGLPANLVISRDGRIVARHIGVSDLKNLEQEIELALAKK